MRWVHWALLSALLAGITAVLAKAGTKDIEPNLATGIRTTVVLLAMDETLDRTADEYPGHAELVKLWHFGGLTTDQAAAALWVSLSTADRRWEFARAWLRHILSAAK